ncbi:MAG: phytanoyl-CoA dioxygenase family protein [Chloroherpetonaceae bacterium]|nr:phytanoyl-CoA dioxygenase family protein [Chthonomonadaceae bacterium]MDW8207207.1 phytanoyl-CoA dioxygenase family protein [Chloroherpetonaceae bacterium]
MTEWSDFQSARPQYEADGFYITQKPLFPQALIADAIAGMDAIRRGEYDTGRPPCPSVWNPGDDPDRLCKIENPQFASRAVRALLRYPALGTLAAALTGATMVQVWWVQLLYKPPAKDDSAVSNIGWHQDRQYWGVWEEGSELFTAWIALSDVTEQSGPMRFVRGSHRWGVLPQGDFFAQDLDALRAQMDVPPGALWEEVPALLPPGGVSVHHCLTLHGSGPNQTDRPRRSFAVHLRTQNARPVNRERRGLTEFIDDPELCPIIYGHL